MKTTRILMMTILMSIFCVTLSYAQQSQSQSQKPKLTPEERIAKRVDMLKKSLNLTDDQTSKVQALQTQMFNDMKQFRGTRGSGEANRGKVKANSGDTKAKAEGTQANSDEMKAKLEKARTEMKAKRDAYDAQLKTILTPDQYQKYQDMQKDRQKNWDKKMQKGQKFQGGHQRTDSTKCQDKK